MSKNNRNSVNSKTKKPSKNTAFGKLMCSLVILGVVLLLFINFALPLLKKEVSHMAAEKTVDIITQNADKIAGDNQEVKKVIESMSDEDKEVVTEIIENHMDAKTATEVMGYVNDGDKEALMKYAAENLTAEETLELINIAGKYADFTK